MKYIVATVMVIYILSVGFILGYGTWLKEQKQSSTDSSSANQETISSTSPAQQTTSESTAPQLNIAEVAKHNTANDCWIIINKNVYDIGRYLDLHPGGADVIVPYCGKDGTQAFETQGGRGRHNSQAQQELKNHLIGPLQ